MSTSLEIGQGCTELRLEEPTFSELALAFKGEGGRSAVRVGREGGSPLGGAAAAGGAGGSHA